MNRAQKLARLAELQAADWPRCTIDNLPMRQLPLIPDNRRDEVAEYLRGFAATRECPSCERGGTFGWGMVHGQGRCVNCGWPGTAYHFVGEGESRLRFEAILWLHPSAVSPPPGVQSEATS